MKVRLVLAILAIAALALLVNGCSTMPREGADQNAAATQNKNDSSAPFSANEKQASTSLVPASVTVPAGTAIAVRLQSSISSASAHPGESFTAVLDEPLVVRGTTAVPKGAAVTGRVVEAKPSGRLHDSGYLRLTLSSIEIKGKAVALKTSSFFAKGANHNKRNAALIGGGTGVGALIGGLAGGGKGALIGAAAGAGAGTGTAYATGKKDIALSAERRLTFRLTQPVVTKD